MTDVLLYKGDCLEEMKKIPDGSVDLVLADPPYGTTACKWDSVIPFEPMWEQLHRVAKKNAAIVLFGSEPFSSALRMSNIKRYRYDWYWKKTRPVNHINANKMPMRYIETLSVFYRSQPLFNRDKKTEPITTTSTTRNTVFGASIDGYKRIVEYDAKFDIVAYGKDGDLHPTQKPVALLEYLIRTYTNEGDTVLDFTMGSGSTGVACVNINRNFIGIELDERYFKIAQERISNAQVTLPERIVID